MAHIVTIGAGNNRPQGKAVRLSNDPVKDLAMVLQRHSSRESWWSGHQFHGNYRSQVNWQAASAIPLDLDYHDGNGSHTRVSEDPLEKSRLIQSWAIEYLKNIVNIIHATPRGVRAVIVLKQPTSDLNEFKSAARGAVATLREELEDLIGDRNGLEIDPNHTDNARFLYTPNAIVSGERRKATVVIGEPNPLDIDLFTDYDPGEQSQAKEEQSRAEQNNRLGHPTEEIVNMLSRSIRQGSRRPTLVTLAGYLRYRGIPKEVALRLLMPWAREAFQDPLPDEEIQKHIEGIYNRYGVNSTNPKFKTLPVGEVNVRYK